MAVAVALVAGARFAGVPAPTLGSDATLTIEEVPARVPSGSFGPGTPYASVEGRVPAHPGGRRDGARGDAEQGLPPAFGSWRTTAPAPVSTRKDAVAVWTGTCAAGEAPPACGEVLVWGGRDHVGYPAVDGVAYDPASDTWRAIPPIPDVTPLTPLSGVWADGVLVVWGGLDPDGVAGRAGALREQAGAVYDPVANTWTPLPRAPVSGRRDHAMVWTGREVVVWGGGRRSIDGGWLDLDNGAAYDPEAGTWRVLSPPPIAGRTAPAAAAADGKLVVWGGHRRGGGGREVMQHDGAVYDPATNRWTRLPDVRASLVRQPGEPVPLTMIAEGDTVLLAGPFVVQWHRHVYARYELGDRRWRLLDAPGGLRHEAAVAGDPNLVIVWGGLPSRRTRPNGVAGVIGAGAWPLTDGGPLVRPGQAVVWTGEAVVIWGGAGEAPRTGALLELRDATG